MEKSSPSIPPALCGINSAVHPDGMGALKKAENSQLEKPEAAGIPKFT
jgi:hypothetical protein